MPNKLGNNGNACRASYYPRILMGCEPSILRQRTHLTVGFLFLLALNLLLASPQIQPKAHFSAFKTPVSRFQQSQHPRRGILRLKVCNAILGVLGGFSARSGFGLFLHPAACFGILPHPSRCTRSSISQKQNATKFLSPNQIPILKHQGWALRRGIFSHQRTSQQASDSAAVLWEGFGRRSLLNKATGDRPRSGPPVCPCLVVKTAKKTHANGVCISAPLSLFSRSGLGSAGTKKPPQSAACSSSGRSLEISSARSCIRSHSSAASSNSRVSSTSSRTRD